MHMWVNVCMACWLLALALDCFVSFGCVPLCSCVCLGCLVSLLGSFVCGFVRSFVWFCLFGSFQFDSIVDSFRSFVDSFRLFRWLVDDMFPPG